MTLSRQSLVSRSPSAASLSPSASSATHSPACKLACLRPYSTNACLGLLALMSRCSSKFISAFLSSLTNLETTAVRSIHAALLRLLDDCSRATDVICDNIMAAAAADMWVSSTNSKNEANTFIVASTNACGIQLSVSLHMTGSFELHLSIP